LATLTSGRKAFIDKNGLTLEDDVDQQVARTPPDVTPNAMMLSQSRFVHDPRAA